MNENTVSKMDGYKRLSVLVVAIVFSIIVGTPADANEIDVTQIVFEKIDVRQFDFEQLRDGGDHAVKQKTLLTDWLNDQPGWSINPEAEGLGATMHEIGCNFSSQKFWSWAGLYWASVEDPGLSFQDLVMRTEAAISEEHLGLQNKVNGIQVGGLTGELKTRIVRDQYWQMSIWEKIRAIPNTVERNVFSLAIEMERCSIYKDNAAYVKDMLESKGWPTLNEYGQEVSHNVWLIIQHSDFDVGFQQFALQKMSALLAKKEVNARNFVYLFDRVLKNTSGATYFGTQVKCEGGKTVPDNLLDPSNVDARRAGYGMEPLTEYITMFQGINKCPVSDDH